MNEWMNEKNKNRNIEWAKRMQKNEKKNELMKEKMEFWINEINAKWIK